MDVLYVRRGNNLMAICANILEQYLRFEKLGADARYIITHAKRTNDYFIECRKKKRSFQELEEVRYDGEDKEGEPAGLLLSQAQGGDSEGRV